jgi:hypothetical protein
MPQITASRSSADSVFSPSARARKAAHSSSAVIDPPPAAAAALLDVAHLRAECLRLGVRAVSVQKGAARFEGFELRKSQEARLKHLVARATVVGDTVVVPVKGDGRALIEGMLRLLAEVVPVDAAPVPSAS